MKLDAVFSKARMDHMSTLPPFPPSSFPLSFYYFLIVIYGEVQKPYVYNLINFYIHIQQCNNLDHDVDYFWHAQKFPYITSQSVFPSTIKLQSLPY